MKAPTLLKKVLAWEAAKLASTQAAALEMKLRLEVCGALAPAGGEGTSNFDLPGYVVTVVNKLNRTLDVVTHYFN